MPVCIHFPKLNQLQWLHLLTFPLSPSAECLLEDLLHHSADTWGPDSLNDKTREKNSQRGNANTFRHPSPRSVGDIKERFKTHWVKKSRARLELRIHFFVISTEMLRIWSLLYIKLSFGYFVSLKWFTMNYQSCASFSFSFDTDENSLQTMCPFTFKLL